MPHLLASFLEVCSVIFPGRRVPHKPLHSATEAGFLQLPGNGAMSAGYRKNSIKQHVKYFIAYWQANCIAEADTIRNEN
jgi:hypothetical protein